MPKSKISQLIGRPPEDPVKRFMRFVRIDPITGCWMWTGNISKVWGYARFFYEGSTTNAHRVSYMLFKGPIPSHLVPDHTCHSNDKTCRGGPTCHHRRCVCPDHLELVTDKENTNRGRRAASFKTHCPSGHPYSAENTYMYTYRRRNPQRMCRACNRERSRRLQAKKVAARYKNYPSEIQ